MYYIHLFYSTDVTYTCLVLKSIEMYLLPVQLFRVGCLNTLELIVSG
jgi:hypothetical protein